MQRRYLSEKKRAPYEDLSTFMSDADDPDDPGFPENYTLGSEPASGGIGMYKPSVTHVIFNKEGSYFPGLVVEVDEPLIWVRSMCKGSNPAPDAWEWPEVEDLEECTEERIEEIIDPPSLASNRESFYWVPAMRNEKYRWGRTFQFSEF